MVSLLLWAIFCWILGVMDERTIASTCQRNLKKPEKVILSNMLGLWTTLKMKEQRGITIDLAFQKFETPKYFFTSN